MCVKNTTYNGCDYGVWSPTNYTTWVVEHVESPIGKTNTPLRKEFPLAPIKEIVTLVLQLSHICFHSMPTIKYKSIAHIPIMTQFPISHE